SAGYDYRSGAPVNGAADGNVTMGDGAKLQTRSGSIVVRAPGDVRVSTINANSDGDATSGNVSVTADYAGIGGGLSNRVGAIIDVLSTESPNIVATKVALQAGSGIGANVAPDAADIDLSVDVLTATTDRGSIHLDSVRSRVSIGAYDQSSGVSITNSDGIATGLDQIVVRSAGALTVDLGRDVINRDGGSIVLAAEGANSGADLTLNASVVATGGQGGVRLFAGRTVTMNGAISASTTGGGAIVASAGVDYHGGAPANGASDADFVMSGGATLQSADGDITVRATRDIRLGAINANSNNDGVIGDVIVTADYAGPTGGLSDGVGAIIDSLSGEAPNITADQVALRAAAGIGASLSTSTEDLDLAARTVSASTVRGSIRIENLSTNLASPQPTNLAIAAFDGLAGVTITGATTSGLDEISIRTPGGLTVAVGNAIANTNGGDITLAAMGTGATSDLSVAANVTTTNGKGAVRLYAGHSLNVTNIATIGAASTGAVELWAGFDYRSGSPALGHVAGDLTLADGTNVGSADGNVTLVATRNVTLSSVSANSDSNGTSGDTLVWADYTGPQPGSYDYLGSLIKLLIAGNWQLCFTGSVADGIGAIIDGTAAEQANVRGTNVTMTAGNGIGGPGDADIDVWATNSLVLRTSTGPVSVTNLNGGQTYTGNGSFTVAPPPAAVSVVRTGSNA
ncbi:MAG TPA: hypothetical protein PLV92_17540, partial [Pirellulaceae bacterium]|nr:hypothetical protein [Pirellulaceae bacterium]